METKTYAKPIVKDYGTLLELTAANGFTDMEDGTSKLLAHHTGPFRP